MDSKKNLKPELKDIYERVMNTNTGSRAPQAPVSSPSATPPQPVAHPQPAAPVQPVVPPQSAPSEAGPADQTSKEPFLASSAPRPLNDSSTFVFSSHGSHPKNERKEDPKKVHHEVKKETVNHQKNTGANPKKAGNKTPIIIILMLVFLVLWAVVWMFALDLI